MAITTHDVPARQALLTPSDSPAALRTCLGRFATGVAVVTFDGPEGRRGLTINSFTSVSLEPPLVLASIATKAKSHDALIGRPFAVNVLGAEQERLARCFAGGEADLEVVWEEGLAPSLPGSLASLICRPWQRVDAGDHSLFLGQVVQFEYREGDALGYVTSRFTTLAEGRLGHEHLI